MAQLSKREWRHVDKSKWGPGPWQDEPDKIQWIDSATNLDCLMVRHEKYGHWCGYVGVPPGHPFHGQHYDKPDVDVHGGLTFADACHEGLPEGHGICHVPETGRPDDVWWFDFHHAFDIAPGFEVYMKETLPAELWADHQKYRTEDTYRDAAYVRNEVESAAKQLKEMTSG